MAVTTFSRILRYLFVLSNLVTFIAASTSTNTSVAYDSYVVQPGKLENVTIAINLPSDNDDLYFHFSSPGGQEWSAFGFGDHMTGALMIVSYISTDNFNITVSPRIATGHTLPVFTKDVDITLLPGTQLTDGIVVVNAKCSGCRKWSSGSIDTKDTSQGMIWAVGPVSTTFVSDDVNTQLNQHAGNAMGSFTLDMQKATGTGGLPVLNQTLLTGNAHQIGNVSTFPIAVHAFIMIFTFLIIFPCGYLFLRMFEKVWIHIAFQSLGLIVFVVGAIAGILISTRRHISPKLNAPHQVFGLIIMALLFVSFIIGAIGHTLHKRNETTQPLVTKVHRIIAPLTIVLGLANVGVGFSFAGNTRRLIPFYVGVLFMLIIMSGLIVFSRRRRMRKDVMNTPAARNFQEGYYNNQNNATRPDNFTTSNYVNTGGFNLAAGEYYASNGAPRLGPMPGESVAMQDLNIKTPAVAVVHTSDRL